jgi:hypothetical protein
MNPEKKNDDEGLPLPLFLVESRVVMRQVERKKTLRLISSQAM